MSVTDRATASKESPAEDQGPVPTLSGAGDRKECERRGWRRIARIEVDG
jgi:hypothetical protein